MRDLLIPRYYPLSTSHNSVAFAVAPDQIGRGYKGPREDRTLNVVDSSHCCRLSSAALVQSAMAQGEHINITEDRAVMHMALRASEADTYVVDGTNVVPDVHAVLKRIAAFAESVRSGEWTGASGKKLTHVVSVGIGGSYLGPEFVFEALRSGKLQSLALSIC